MLYTAQLPSSSFLTVVIVTFLLTTITTNPVSCFSPISSASTAVTRRLHLGKYETNKRWMVLKSGESGALIQNQTNSIASEWIETFFETGSLEKSVDSLNEQNNIKKKEEFDWFNHWYPLHVVDTMDATRPHKAQLLGMNLVLWNDGATDQKNKKQPGNWNAYRDSCPHRRAPLSEGRVEDDGSLLCSYHGWRFNGESSSSENGAAAGQCCSLPYSPQRFEDRHMAKAHCEVFATKVVDGMLWVFPQSGLEGILASENRPLPLISELHGNSTTEWQSRIPAGVRDFPCGFDTMIENTLDPAHFCSAHHGTLGNRYTDPSAYDFRVTQPLTMKDGFAIDGDMGSLEFVPPCLVKYRPDYSAMPFQKNLLIATYCVPTKPGWVRPLATVLVRKSKNSDADGDVPVTLSKRALDIFMGPFTPAWFGHIASSIVLHQDAGLLHNQYRNMRSMGYYNNNQEKGSTKEKNITYQDLCYTPNRVDKGIITFRRWFDTMAGGDVPWSCDNPLDSDNNNENVDIYDMWNAHTKNCQYCSTVYARLEAVKKGAFAISLAALLFLPYESSERITVTLMAGGLAFGLEQFNQLFIRYEYHHHDND